MLTERTGPKNVWVIEYGSGSGRAIGGIFTTREAAIDFLLRRHGFESEKALVDAQYLAGDAGRFPLPDEYELWDSGLAAVIQATFDDTEGEDDD